MTSWTLIRRSLRFYARAHLGVALGAAIGSAALIGALIVGDSVHGTLRERALARLGKTWFAMNTGDRPFLASFRNRLDSPTFGGSLGPGSILPSSAAPLGTALALPAVVTRADGSARANQVRVLGVDSAWASSAGWSGLSSLGEGGWLGNSPDLGVALALGDDGIERKPGELDRLLPGLGMSPLIPWKRGQTVFVNETLARRLSVRPGDEIIVRVRKPTALGLDAALSPRDENTLALRFQVGAVLPAAMLADFGLSAGQMPSENLFVPLSRLTENTGMIGRANLLLFGEALAQRRTNRVDVAREAVAAWLRRHGRYLPPETRPDGLKYVRLDPKSFAARLAREIEPRKNETVPEEGAIQLLKARVKSAWDLEDAAVSVRFVEPPRPDTGGRYAPSWIEVTSSRVFLDPQVVAAAMTPRTTLITNLSIRAQDTSDDIRSASFVTNGVSVLTYLANLIRVGDRATPYSMVTAADGPYVHFDPEAEGSSGGQRTGNDLSPAQPDLRDDEILVNQWLADDLKVKPGDSVDLSYFVPDSGSRLAERTNSFRVRAIVPLKGIWADRTLMPDFPGVSKAESTRDWDTGFPLTYKIREQDEAYWKAYRGTPKAFVTLTAGRKMWGNRFGSLTAIRYAVPDHSLPDRYLAIVHRNLLANLDPAQLGLHVEPVRRQALAAADQAQDFGQLFLGFSFFLVVAALLLMALLFQFGLEQRAAEVGTLLALGFTAKQVRRLLLGEGAVLALAGGCLGALGGVGYAKAMLWALATLWPEAVGNASLEFHVTGLTLLVGLCSSTVVGVLTLWFTLRKQARQPIARLLAGGGDTLVESQPRRMGGRARAVWLGIGSALAGIGLGVWGLAAGGQGEAGAGAFFGAGSLCLIAGLAFAAAWLRGLSRANRLGTLTLGGLGIRHCARRLNRSLATVALLACGAFLITSIGVFRIGAMRDASDRRSGTGGFALIGQLTIPVAQDLNTVAGRDALGLDAAVFAGVGAVQFRVHDGDEASCLNLNRAQRPRLLGVQPEALSGRFTFEGAAKGLDWRQGWDLLKLSVGGGVAAAAGDEPIPAIGDANTLEWALGKSLGDTLDYTDELGRPFKVRLAGAVANSILQEGLIIDEAEFVKRFPNEGGYRMFLLDAPVNAAPQVSAALSRALQDSGMEVSPAAARLDTFNAVQNTYLNTFQILGGLGLLLGSAGLGVVVLRNVLERRGELGLLTAVGFRAATLQQLVLGEHAALLGLGLGIGVAAAAVAVLPSLIPQGTQAPWRSLAPTLAAVLLNGLVWTWLATRLALRGNVLVALRNE